MEQELLSYCDSTGYLSREKRFEFLAKKKVIRIQNGEPIILIDKDGKTNYIEIMKTIDDILKRNQYKKQGQMKILPETNQANEINPDDIDI